MVAHRSTKLDVRVQIPLRYLHYCQLESFFSHKWRVFMTRRQNEVAPVVITPLNVSDDIRNKIFVTIDGRDWQKDLSELGLTFDSSERDIMSRLTPLIQEEFNQDISDAYKIRKAVNSQNIYCIPNSVAGILF